MEFHSMKRKRLQSLCKKHGIPANLKNKDMADRLSLILKGKENTVSCQLGSDHAGREKDLLIVETVEVKSSNGDNLQMVASDTVAGNVDATEEKFVTSGKRSPSPNLEERIGFSPKLLKNSEIERLESKTNLSPEKTRDDIGICDVEENMRSGLKKEQVDDSQEGLHSGVVDMKDVDLVQVTSEEFRNHLEEAEAEKLGDNTDFHDDFCGTGKGGAEAEKQDDTNPQGSNINDVNLLLVFPEEYGCPLVEGEVHKSDDNIGVHGGVYNIVNKEQVDDSVMSDAGPVQVASDEFGNYLVEGEVEKLDDKTDVHEVVCGTGIGGAEAEKQDDTNSPQESNINDLNILQISPEGSGYPLVEGEVHESDDNICVHDGIYNVRNSRSDADTMCLDTSIGAKDTDEKAYLTAEHSLDEVHSSSFKDSDGTPVRFLPTYPPIEVKSGDLNIHQMDVSGTATGNADSCEAKFVSSQKISLSPDSEKIDFSPKLLNNSDTKGLKSELNLSPETPRDDIGICDMEENMQSGVNKEQVYDSQEVLHAASCAVVLKDVDLVQVASEEFGNYLVEREVEKLVDKTDVHEDVCGTGKGGAEDKKQDDTNSPQGSNINDMNLLNVSPEESGYPLVEGEVHKSDDTICIHGGVYNFGNSGSEVDTMCLLDTSIAAKDTDGKTNLTAEHFPDEVHSSSFKYSDGTPDQFLTTYSEMNSSDLKIHQMVASDACQVKLESSLKKGLVADLAECIVFYPKHLEASEVGFEAETNFDPSTLADIVVTCNMKESMQSAKTGLVAYPEQRIEFSPKHLEASVAKCLEAETNFNPSTIGDVLGTCGMEESLQSVKNEKVDCSQEVLHSTTTAVVINDVDLLQRSMEECNSVQGEFTGLFHNSDVHDHAGETAAEDENKSYMVSPKREKRDMDSLGKYFLNEFQSVDNASDQNSDETPEDYVQTMPQPGENKSCTFNIHQMFASDEDIYKEKLELSPKCTPVAVANSEESNSSFPKLLESSMMKKDLEIETNLPLKSARDILGTCDMKENIKIGKKEQLGSVISKKAFPKRQPLQDLQQK